MADSIIMPVRPLQTWKLKRGMSQSPSNAPTIADRSVPDKSETVAAQHLADQPTCERADNQNDQHTLICKMQRDFLRGT